jgi:hypothetical protein
MGTAIAELSGGEVIKMKKFCLAIGLALALSACSKGDALDIPAGSDVTIQKKDGVEVVGRVVEVKADQVVLQLAAGGTSTVARSEIASVKEVHALKATGPEPKAAPATDPVGTGGEVKAPAAAAPAGEPASPAAADLQAAAKRSAAGRAPEYREVTIPAGTVLPLELKTSVSSDGSKVEDPVRATLRRAVTVDGVQALPAGTSVSGHVSDVARSAKVKGRARVAFRFTQLDPPGPDGSTSIRTGTVAREAAGTKKQDAAKIGGGAVGGAIIGGIIGGGDGAAKGAAIGGAGGTGVVLATRGKEVRLPAGTPISVKLSAPLTLRVAVR